MIRPTIRRPWALAAFLVLLCAAAPVGAQSHPASRSSAPDVQSWPRWQAPEPVAPRVDAPQAAPPSGDGEVLALSVLGAAGGWAVGILAGVGICWNGCGDGEYDALVPVLLMGVAGGGVGSAFLGCTAAREHGCTPRVLPAALLGSVAAAVGSVAVASATENGLAALVAFSAIQGLLTTTAIR
ncbi:MAG TPA: hypothetical protein VJ997_00915 [Longimicrobiales bacterium]|nr:hypothetical protein [Longimicrobiales bacterium]